MDCHSPLAIHQPLMVYDGTAGLLRLLPLNWWGMGTQNGYRIPVQSTCASSIEEPISVLLIVWFSFLSG